jgi:AraC-like DNA-binding protein
MVWWGAAGGADFDLGGAEGDLWIFVNLEGRAELVEGRKVHPLPPGWVAVGQVRGELAGRFKGHEGETHRFLWLSVSEEWMRRWLGPDYSVNQRGLRMMGISERVKRAMEEMVGVRVDGDFLAGWYQAKALEIVIGVLNPREEEFFCERQQRVAHERVEKVKGILARDLEHPPALPEISKEVGCSPHYLSRIFSQETGTTISRYLRDLRLDRAAAILKMGKSNVTEAAMEVGYSSLSHFSKAFAARFGVCPCVFPLNPSLLPAPKQKPPVRRKRDSESPVRELQKSS